jgi:rubredoxin
MSELQSSESVWTCAGCKFESSPGSIFCDVCGMDNSSFLKIPFKPIQETVIHDSTPKIPIPIADEQMEQSNQAIEATQYSQGFDRTIDSLLSPNIDKNAGRN